MRPLRSPNALAFPTFVVASALVASGVWAFLHSPGKNNVDSTPLIWLFVLLIAPLLSLVCVVDMWLEERSKWLIGGSALLLLPQAVVWLFATVSIFNYL